MELAWSSEMAEMEAKTAPTPIGPKWPTKAASCQLLMSGQKGRMTSASGIRRRKITVMANRISRQMSSPKARSLNCCQGMMAPKYTK